MKRKLHLISLFVVGTIVTLTVLSVPYWTGCNKTQEIAGTPYINNQQETILFTKENPRVKAVMAVQDRHTNDIMAYPNVVGTATGLTDDGRLAIMVYLKDELTQPVKGRGVCANGIPQSIEGIPVVREITGELKAMAAHTAKQTPPIQLGTSGSWRYDLANGYCCGGTIGSLVKKGTIQYILSNYHVFMADIVSGGNGRIAKAGDPVIQPGLIDVNCNASLAQNVGTLEGTKSLPSSNVDAALAQVISGMVKTDGSILEVGTISVSTVAASVNQAVKKSGRTTGLTRSTVSGLNGTVQIAYENECAGGAAFTKTFTGQIIIKDSKCKFLNSGDSGSLLVEDVTTNPRAVGLCFAGSSRCNNSSIAIANPINEVLNFFGATMVGK